MMKLEDFSNRKEKICIIGLGYVGRGYDHTGEIESERLLSTDILFTSDPSIISQAKVVIITVPTPVDEHNKPDLSPMEKATRTVARYLKSGSIIVYESTVYPGATEEICIPILEEVSKLEWKRDFFVGYSPERVNPGDKEHTIDKIIKVVAGDCKETTDFLVNLYGSVIPAGVHRAPDIKTAEASKVIENTQRDLNIALMNELALIFNKLGIQTREVLKAAGSKWNFLNFYPGFVGGHCIGVDPYYLTFKAESIGYHPEVILAGRRINDSMGKYIAEVTVKNLIKAGRAVKKSKVLILGITFKENIADIRNTRVVDIYHELLDYEVVPFIYDPYAAAEEVREEYNISLLGSIEDHQPYDAVIAAVSHREFAHNLDLDKIISLQSDNQPVLVDVNNLFSKEEAEKKGVKYWGL